jgi:DNA-directed RNA polymerase subunit RPC12/RpoP
MPENQKSRCPNCQAGMQLHQLPGHYNQTVTIDACQACAMLWFDKGESAQLSPDGVVELFQIVSTKGGLQTPQLAPRLGCVRCSAKLTPRLDQVVTGRFNYFACVAEHGRLISFHQFLIEKRFVRNLTSAELQKLAVEVKQIKCSGCGAPVDLSTQSACSYCRSPVAVFDREAAKKAIDHYLVQRGKQLPARPDSLPNSQYRGADQSAGYSKGELALDVLWAMAQFSRFNGHVPSRASQVSSSGMASESPLDQMGSLFSESAKTGFEVPVVSDLTDGLDLTDPGSSLIDGGGDRAAQI